MEQEMRQDNAEPTVDDLQAAWTQAIHADGIPGAQGSALLELRRMRDAKWTWFGVRELELRAAIDAYLDAKEPASYATPKPGNESVVKDS